MWDGGLGCCPPLDSPAPPKGWGVTPCPWPPRRRPPGVLPVAGAPAQLSLFGCRYQGLKESCFPALLDQFASSHQCNPFCEMLGLQPLKGPEAAHPPGKAKGSKSPSTGRKGGQLSPQPQKKGLPSPQGTRKSTPSTKATPPASGALATQLLGQPPTQEGSSKAQGLR